MIPYLKLKRVFMSQDNIEHSLNRRDTVGFCVFFELPAEFDGIIHVKFIRAWYWNLALIISLISWCIVIVYLAKRRYVCENGALK